MRTLPFSAAVLSAAALAFTGCEPETDADLDPVPVTDDAPAVVPDDDAVITPAPATDPYADATPTDGDLAPATPPPATDPYADPTPTNGDFAPATDPSQDGPLPLIPMPTEDDADLEPSAETEDSAVAETEDSARAEAEDSPPAEAEDSPRAEAEDSPPAEDSEGSPATEPLLQPEDSGNASVSYEGFDPASLPGEFEDNSADEAQASAIEEASPAGS